MQNFENVKQAAEYLRNGYFKESPEPKIALILGTGLSDAADDLFRTEPARRAPFSALPNFPTASVASHAGEFIWGFIEQIPVVIQSGRLHLYEGKTPAEICMGVRLMRELGAKILVTTNAAGALNPLFECGSLMSIADQINLTGQSPLTGKNEERWGERFPDMSRVYDADLLHVAQICALEHNIKMEKGVYAGVRGPEMETPAETRMLRMLGADAVGMSTTLEVIAAKHAGMRILGISCITNVNLPDSMRPASLESIIRVARECGKKLEKLFPSLIKKIGSGSV